ncbi:tandem-type lipoprotein [Staphylococcus pasteuri]|uniref:tandem-type lipoprotein n=1 Tax=Staphylococcus pasteuri TaxID=45972 RepID=UPI000F842FC2|nr:tandem-type lipoprotein [Staphylococcus pasteuri]MEB6612706.1 tandem-type lipoprotein [Staphylococcus pasteuri]QQN54217.1 tandem-type lipoprotein [Staphylococcus pasteuri]RTX71368.1 tandem-type lipoprotein [Staphylococcus pasteuri]
MNISKKWLLVIIIPLAIVLIIVGIYYSWKLKKENEIKDSFAKTLKMYPIKNLEDLYDKEGYRDEEFDKDDKGEWILRSAMATTNDEDELVSEGMLLKFNRNTKTAKGYYFINKFSNDNSKYDLGEKRAKYPVELKNKHIHITKDIKDKKLKNKIKTFNFFAQYANFKDLKKYKNGNIEYNPEVPSYSAKYQLSNSDFNVKKIREIYKVPTKKAPKFTMKGTGELSGVSIGDQSIEYTFEEGKKNNIYFTDSIEYQPTKN